MKRGAAVLILLFILVSFGRGLQKFAVREIGSREALYTGGQESEETTLKVEISAEDFRKSILRVCPDAVLEGDPSCWVEQVKRTETGAVNSAIMGGREISALALRQIFLLGSGDFELRWTGECFLFSVNSVDKTYCEA